MNDANVKFCLFIGYPRSGHSLIGALMDAHPEMVISHEVHVLERFLEGEDRHRLFFRIIAATQVQAGFGRMADEYSYSVPGWWQGRFSQVKVIGDKKGGGTTGLLAQTPGLLAHFRREMRMPTRFIHVWRNPFDNITTMLLRAHKAGRDVTLGDIIAEYAALARANARLRQELAGELFEISHEDFIADPADGLGRICRFLDVAAEPEYLKACAAIVFDKARPSRHKIDWPEESRRAVMELVREIPFLAGYGFED